MEQDYEAPEAAEAVAKEWWNDLRDRSLGTCHVCEWGYLWIDEESTRGYQLRGRNRMPDFRG